MAHIELASVRRAPAGTQPSAQRYRAELIAIYTEFQPSKLADVDDIMAHYAERGPGGMEMMIAHVQAKYAGSAKSSPVGMARRVSTANFVVEFGAGKMGFGL